MSRRTKELHHVFHQENLLRKDKQTINWNLQYCEQIQYLAINR